MFKGDWNQVLGKLNFYRGGSINPLHDSSLTKYEKESGFMLPVSYRIFQVDFSAGCGEVLEIITQYFYTA